MASGYLLARGECQVIAMHDCNILDYSRELLARLLAALPDFFGRPSGREPRHVSGAAGKRARNRMTGTLLPNDAWRAIDAIGKADIVIRIPS
jgi:hypothetical protein